MSLFNKIKSVFNSSSDDVPDAQTIYFKNGEMYKVYPTDKESWYDARYLVSDGVKYDLENLDDLKRIPVPKFPPHKNIMEGYGVTGNLDYILRMKAGSFYNRKDKIMCSACLWKCTELMLAHPLSWEESHFYRIVQWHVEMGMFDEADKAEKYIYSVLDHDANYRITALLRNLIQIFSDLCYIPIHSSANTKFCACCHTNLRCCLPSRIQHFLQSSSINT